MNILLLASHSVAEYDDIRMFTDMGYDVFCPGGYQNPAEPGESLRPALPEAPYHPDLVEACEAVRRRKGDPGNWIDWAKASLPDEVIDWADVIICHHFPERWIGPQWDRIKHKRVIWRTCGQSSPDLEQTMKPLYQQGMEIVRYSPKEREAFEAIGMFAGEDAVIRFGKYPDDYGPWIGDDKCVGNVTQDMVARGDATGLGFWRRVTEGLPVCPAGKGSEALGGCGELPYHGMLGYLRHMRVYLYTGTRPASYTLGLIEAAMSGIPVVSIPARAWGAGWGGASLFEGHEIARFWYDFRPNLDILDIVEATHNQLKTVLEMDELARTWSEQQRDLAIRTFGIERIAARWRDYLEGRSVEPEPEVTWNREAVTA